VPPQTQTQTQTQTHTTAAQTATPVATGPRVVFPDGFVVSVEVVSDEESRSRGLMYRDQLLPGTGMLFIFPEDGHYPFWMKNTLIPLDMIWIGTDGKVAHVKYDVPPCKADPCPSYPPNATARYVLEVAGGVARQHGLKAGDAVQFVDLERFLAK
jgi:uncharacterized membrane protein (UPF0127 family)